MKYLFLIIFVLISCSSETIRVSKQHHNIDPVLQPYVDSFIMDSQGNYNKYHYGRLTAGFEDMKWYILGVCHYGSQEISINRKWWNGERSQSEKIQLVYHELGHCLLAKPHNNRKSYITTIVDKIESFLQDMGIFEIVGFLPDGCPASIMHPETSRESCFDTHYDYYIDELFDRVEPQEYIEHDFNFKTDYKYINMIYIKD